MQSISVATTHERDERSAASRPVLVEDLQQEGDLQQSDESDEEGYDSPELDEASSSEEEEESSEEEEKISEEELEDEQGKPQMNPEVEAMYAAVKSMAQQMTEQTAHNRASMEGQTSFLKILHGTLLPLFPHPLLAHLVPGDARGLAKVFSRSRSLSRSFSRAHSRLRLRSHSRTRSRSCFRSRSRTCSRSRLIFFPSPSFPSHFSASFLVVYSR